MGNVLKNALEEYSKNDVIYEICLYLIIRLLTLNFKKLLENNKNDTEPLMNECLDTLCAETLNRGKNHTSVTLLTLAKLFMKIGDFRLACEVIWCSVSLAIQEFIALHGLNVRLHSHTGKANFMQALSRELARQFSVFEVCHSSFYTNKHNSQRVNFAFEEANDFIRNLQTFVLTDEKKKELEKGNFND
ncbi:hypothetical protein M3Y98_00479100 [Aphelenchoides besseyi]|nr:hypothetical protein M3Y98_00479100 [Aphelenchoides besseyi]